MLSITLACAQARTRIHMRSVNSHLTHSAWRGAQEQYHFDHPGVVFAALEFDKSANEVGLVRIRTVARISTRASTRAHARVHLTHVCTTLCALVDVPTTVQRGPATPLPKNGTTAVQYTLRINQVHRLPTVARRV